MNDDLASRMETALDASACHIAESVDRLADAVDRLVAQDAVARSSHSDTGSAEVRSIWRRLMWRWW